MIKYLKGRIRSLQHALNGVGLFVQCGANMHINFLALVVVSAAGLYFEITAIEWCLVILCFIVVIATEAMNTALERLINHLHPGRHPEVGKIKDLTAGASLVLVLGAGIIGFIIFGKYIAALFS